MALAGAFYPFRLWTAYALFAVLAVAVYGYGAVDAWVRHGLSLAILAVGAVWSFRRLLGPYPFVKTWFYAVPALPAAVALVQGTLGLSADPYATADAFAFWSVLTLWLVLLVNVFDDTAIRRRFVRALPWLAAAASTWALVELYAAPLNPELWRDAPSTRAFGGFANGTHFVVLMELLFPVAVYLALEQRGRVQLAYIVVCGLITGAVLASGAASGVLVLFAELCAVLVLHVVLAIRSSSRRRRARMLVSAAALAVGAAVMIVANGAYRLVVDDSALTAALTAERQVAGMSRSVAARGVWEMFLDRPLLGHGAGAFGAAFPAYQPIQDGLFWNHAQNDPLELAAEIGVAGLLVQALVVGLILLRRRSARVWTTAILPLAAVWAHSLVEFPLRTPALPLAALVLLALVPTDGGVAVERPETTGTVDAEDSADGLEAPLAAASRDPEA